ncbi:MAG: tripartite tricarboxylate transporter substrate-binding protein, partial [Betaproteobacteria bacterium]
FSSSHCFRLWLPIPPTPTPAMLSFSLGAFWAGPPSTERGAIVKAEAVIAAASGQAPVGFPSLAGAIPMIDSGRLRPLAVTSLRRASSLPNVPTLDETLLKGFDYVAWYGVAVPSSTPKEIVARLNAALGKIVLLPDVKEAFNKQGFEAQAGTPEEFTAIINREIEQTVKLIQITGLKAE